MAEIRKLNIALAAIAVIILVASCATFAYTIIPHGKTGELAQQGRILVNGTEYTWDGLFDGSFALVNFTARGNIYTGVRLTDLLNATNVPDQSAKLYRFIGADDYEKTTDWGYVSTGFLVKDGNGTVHDKIVIFPEVTDTKSFWVYDLVIIEVV